MKPFRRPTILIGAGLVGIWVLVAVFAPLLAPFDPLKSLTPLASPGAPAPGGGVFWLGTDLLGRDILSRLIYGARPVVALSTLATLTAYGVGVSAGLLAGYYGRWIDTGLSFLANVILSFPVLVLYIVVIVAGISQVVTGLLIWKPVQFSTGVALLGGFQAVRLEHFLGMTVIVGFVVVHVALSILVPRTLWAMLSGGPRIPGPTLRSPDGRT